MGRNAKTGKKGPTAQPDEAASPWKPSLVKRKALRDFHSDIAALTQLPLETIKKLETGLFVTTLRHLRETCVCRIPKIAKIRVVEKPPRSGYVTERFGKVCHIKARLKPVKRIYVSCIKPLQF